MKGELRVCAHNNHPKQHSDSALGDCYVQEGVSIVPKSHKLSNSSELKKQTKLKQQKKSLFLIFLAFFIFLLLQGKFE